MKAHQRGRWASGNLRASGETDFEATEITSSGSRGPFDLSFASPSPVPPSFTLRSRRPASGVLCHSLKTLRQILDAVKRESNCLLLYARAIEFLARSVSAMTSGVSEGCWGESGSRSRTRIFQSCGEQVLGVSKVSLCWSFNFEYRFLF